MMNKHISLAGTATVGPKGQVVIPAEVREAMGIEPGTKLIAFYIASKKSIAFVTEAQAQVYIQHMGEEFTRLKETLEKEG